MTATNEKTSGYQVFEECSMAGILFNRAARFRDKVYLQALARDGRQTNRWESYTWAQVLGEIEHLLTAFRLLGLNPGDRVAVLGKNRPRWVFTTCSLIGGNIVFVPVYPTLTALEIGGILGDSGASFLVCDTLEQVQKVLPLLSTLPSLKKIFVMDAIEKTGHEWVETYDQLLERGAGKVDRRLIAQRVQEIRSEDPAAIIYTSGTTGQQKGVVLSNGNFLSQQPVAWLVGFTADDIFLNHMPFSHSFGLTTDLLCTLMTGATLVINEGFASEQIRQGLTTIRPTVLMSVPRLFEKLYVEIHRVVSAKPRIIQKLFDRALKVGKAVFDKRCAGGKVPWRLGLEHRLVRGILERVRRQAGLERLRCAFAGGGPTSRELCVFFQSLGIDIYQGYGLTETSPICNVNVPGKNRLGTVGPAIPGVEEKLAPDGEILVRGKNVMLRYHNLPEATAEAIDAEGWLHTGDVGSIDEDGYLRIIDRKKELIINSAGKNMSPIAIEAAIKGASSLIGHAVAIGDGRPYNVALIVLDPDVAAGRAHDDPELVREIRDAIERANQRLARVEQVKRFHIVADPWEAGGACLTPTSKLKRKPITARYAGEIEALYALEPA